MKQEAGHFFLRDKAMPYTADEKGIEIQLYDDAEPHQCLTITWFHIDRLRELVKEE